jgi:hypothetical protein
MKKLLLAYFIILAFTASGQNYRCLQPGVKNFFINSDGYLRGIRIDSVKTYADSTVFYPYRTPRGPYDTGPTGHGMNITDPIGGSWLGKKVTELTDGTTIFDSYWKDSVVIKTRANVGDSWTMYTDSGSVYYTATVTNKDTLTVMSALDSAKYIRVNAFNGSGPLTADPLDNLVIILSKSNGFAQVVDLYTFPYHKADSVYRAGLDYFLDRPMDLYAPPMTFDITKMLFKIVDFVNPNDQQLYNWDVGTIIHSLQTCGVPIYGPYSWEYLANTVVSASTAGHVVTYTLEGSGPSLPCPPSSTYPHVYINKAGGRNFNDTLYSILNPNRMPEDGFGGNFVFYNPDDDFCFHAPAYNTKPVLYVRGLGGHNESFSYKLGIGLTRHNYSDGEPTFESSSLKYFKSNTVACGTPVATTNLSNSEHKATVSPNPATDELTIKARGPSTHTITMQNLLGQAIKAIQTNRPEEVLGVSDLPNGMYIIDITDEAGNKSSHKVMIQH